MVFKEACVLVRFTATFYLWKILQHCKWKRQWQNTVSFHVFWPMRRRIKSSFISHYVNSLKAQCSHCFIWSIKYAGNDCFKYQTVFCFLGGSWFPPAASLRPLRLGKEAEADDPRARDRYHVRPDICKSKTGKPLQSWQEVSWGKQENRGKDPAPCIFPDVPSRYHLRTPRYQAKQAGYQKKKKKNPSLKTFPPNTRIIWELPKRNFSGKKVQKTGRARV